MACMLGSTASLAREDRVRKRRAGLLACIEGHGRRVCLRTNVPVQVRVICPMN